MSEAVANGHLSIGEVLALVQADFPDVTISKIRFLESQGLIAPERTASGYRKFYDADIERLRWILAQQRDHFLPLKVIKKMLDQGVDVSDPSQVQPSLFSSPDEEPLPADEPTERRSPTPRSAAHPAVKSSTKPAPRAADPGGTPEETAGKRHTTPADVVAALQEDPRPAKAARRGTAAPAEDAETPAAAPVPAPSRSGALGTVAQGEPMTREELCAATGLTEDLVVDLERYGLLVPTTMGGVPTYDAECHLVATAAARYVEMGVEPRHLRMYKVAAEREAGFVEQLVMPLLKQRNPVSREQAVERTDELLALGAELHASLLRRQLGPVLGT